MPFGEPENRVRLIWKEVALSDSPKPTNGPESFDIDADCTVRRYGYEDPSTRMGNTEGERPELGVQEWLAVLAVPEAKRLRRNFQPLTEQHPDRRTRENGACPILVISESVDSVQLVRGEALCQIIRRSRRIVDIECIHLYVGADRRCYRRIRHDAFSRPGMPTR